jgi:branched-chain amino acid transport system substrate-binding protein
MRTRGRRILLAAAATLLVVGCADAGDDAEQPAVEEAEVVDDDAEDEAVEEPADEAVEEPADEVEEEAEPTDAVAPVTAMDCDPDATLDGEPIVVGGSMSLTGPLAPTGTIHDAVGELVVDWVNSCGGLLGRPLAWEVLDDQSSPEQAASNYERLIGREVDLVMGPYAGANILAAAGPVARAGYIYPTHTNGSPEQLIGDNHFPSWQIGGGAEDPEEIFLAAASGLWDALESTGNPPETVFYATARFPTTISLASATQAIAEAAGAETVDFVEYDLGTTDFSSIALRISAADPDFIYLGALAADAVEFFDAFESIGYEPKGIYAALPAPATLPAIGPAAEGLMVLSIYENHPPFTDNPIAAEFAERFLPLAEERSLFPVIETQAAASMGAWQIVLTAVAETEEIDNAALQDWLNANAVPSIAGELTFDGWNNYGTDMNRVTQIQNGERVVVWPQEVAAADVVYER